MKKLRHKLHLVMKQVVGNVGASLYSVVGIVPGLQAGKSRVRKRARATNNSFLHDVQSESGSCPASCSMNTDDVQRIRTDHSPGGKTARDRS